MILTGPEILHQISLKNIIIDPFNYERLNPNSYNLRLGSKLLRYASGKVSTSRPPAVEEEIDIPVEGYTLEVGKGYIGHTIEKVWCDAYVPEIQGRSSTGRLFLLVHCTAGYGDHGFNGQWTLEIVPLVHDVLVFAGDELLQIQFSVLYGKPSPYKGRYQNQLGPVVSKGV